MNLADHLGPSVDVERFPELAQKPPPNFGKRADARNKKAIAKAVESAGPLFAEHAVAEVRLTNAAEERERWRVAQVSKADQSPFYSPFMRSLQWLVLSAIETFAKPHCGDGWEGLRQYIRKTYPMPDYGYTVWADILCRCRRVVYSWRRSETGGRIQLEEDGAFQLAEPVITADEFRLGYWIPIGEQPPSPTEEHDEAMYREFVARLQNQGRAS